MADRDRLLERMRQQRDALRADVAQSSAPGVTTDTVLGCQFCKGARVFDRVSGRYGVVVDTAVDQIVAPPRDGAPAAPAASPFGLGQAERIELTRVHIDNWVDVWRHPSELVAVPAPPSPSTIADPRR